MGCGVLALVVLIVEGPLNWEWPILCIALEVIASLVRTGRSSFDGRWTTMRDAALIPAARPDLPILVAASGPRMLGLTARHADAWNGAWFGRPTAPRLIAEMAMLDEACRVIGRDPRSLARTVGLRVDIPDLLPPKVAPPSSEAPGGGAPWGGTPAAEPEDPATRDPDRVLAGTTDEIAAGLRAFDEAGHDHLMVWLAPETEAALERLGDALRRYGDRASAAQRPR